MHTHLLHPRFRLGGVLARICLSLIALAPIAAQAQSYTLFTLGSLGGGFSSGHGVNASGQVVGYSDTARGYNHAFLSGANGAALTAANDLGTLGGNSSRGFGVNASGQVVGYSDTTSGNTHAFLSGPNGTALTAANDLGTLPGGNFSIGLGVNASGQVVGYSDTTSGNTHAFVFSNGVLTDLNTLITPGSGFTLIGAYGISDNGFITGDGTYSNGLQEAFVLTPIRTLISLTFPSPVPGGTILTATVTLSGPAPADIVVGLSSSDSSVVRLHRAVLIPAGASSATFTINTYPNPATQMVTITATLGQTVLTMPLTITGR